LVRSKTRVPAIADIVIPRRRVVEELVRAAEGRSVLEVVASAGSGKTTAVVQFVAARAGPCGWLTLGESDGSPGRFITYLAAAADAIEPTASRQTTRRLAAGVSPADCAAMLAESLGPGATLVIDDLHLIEERPSVLTVLRALTASVAPEALLVLVSRRLVHLDLSRSFLTGAAGAVSGRELAFNPREVGELLAAYEAPGSAEEIAETSGGWAAGIVFDARLGDRESIMGDAARDPFFEYLGAEVLAPLACELRGTVIRSAVLDLVEPVGLAALLDIPSADSLCMRIRRHHLPCTVEPEGVRYHPRFREFLLSLLAEDREEYRLLMTRNARRLRHQGHGEEAADALLLLGEVDEAADVIEEAGGTLIARGDWEKVTEWCEVIGEERLSRRPALREVHLGALMAGRRRDLSALAERLVASGEYSRLARDAPDAATMAVWGLHMSGDWRGALALVPPDDRAPGARAMRYVLEVGSGDRPPRPWPLAELSTIGPNVQLLQCGLYFQGRLDDVEEMARIDATGSREGDLAGRTDVYLIPSLRERGRIGDARARFELGRRSYSASAAHDFWRHLEGELLFAEGDSDGGLAAVREARAIARDEGHVPADRGIFAATEGKMLVRMGRFDEACTRLEDARAWCDGAGLPCFAEWARTWLAAAMLGRGDDPARAVVLLEEAIAGMEVAERHLELPAALAFLAEARWRTGDREGHEEAARRALRAARDMGTLGPLAAALRDVPDVLSRSLEADGADAEEWRLLARGDGPADVPTASALTRLTFGTLGRLRAVVEGAEVEVTPILALAVGAEVARAGRRGVPRSALVERLSGHSTDPQGYLRQLVLRLRRIAPAGVGLVTEDGIIRWSPPGAVVTEDAVLRSLIAQAGRESGEQRLEMLGAVHDLAGQGELVVASDMTGGVELRDDLARRVAEARREHAECLLAAGRPVVAVEVARGAVEAEPLREDGWSVLMRATAAVSGPAAALGVFSECAAALGAIGVEPSATTRTLMEALRAPEEGLVSARR
jgi:hypothetical protein